MRRLATLAMVSGMVLAPLAASAQTPPATTNEDDLRCLAIMSVIAKSEQYKSLGVIGAIYFAGKVQGRDPGFDYEAAIVRLAKQMKVAGGEMRRCAEEATAVAGCMKAIESRMPDNLAS